MIRHLFKLVWNRKRANGLIMLEILLSFFVLFAVLTPSLALIGNSQRPLGYEWRGVWQVRLDLDDAVELEGASNVELAKTVQRLLREMKSFPEVESAAGGMTPPYSMSTMEGGWNVDGRRFSLTFDEVTDEYANVMKMNVVRGRWFRPEDDAAGYQPVVISSSAALDLYPNEEPLGQKFDKEAEREMRVVGIIDHYRKDGELSRPRNMVFRRIAANGAHGRVPRYFMLRVRPGTPIEFEEKLYARLGALAPDLSFRIRQMEQTRASGLRMFLTPLALGGLVALFLVSMVALGLTGVLWQNVTKRMRELGVRRALGATGKAVRMQVLAEVMLLATIAVVIGTAIVIQIPLMGFFAWIRPAAYAIGLIGALATIYALTLLCAWYPSWLASRVEPAEALRYE
jgi:putative ABC transport system permease protein